MNLKIRQCINLLKKTLEEYPETFMFGYISDGTSFDKLKSKEFLFDFNKPILKPYIDFLEETAEAWFGNIVLFNLSILHEFQYYVEELQSLKEEWICIGKIISDPLLINNCSGEVHLFSGYPYSIIDKQLGSFEHFLLNYVFGKGYSELIPWIEEDDWYQFLEQNKILSN